MKKSVKKSKALSTGFWKKSPGMKSPKKGLSTKFWNLKASPKKRVSPKKSTRAKRSPKKSPKAAKRSPKAKSCSAQTTKKYTDRSSPPYPANECCDQEMMGNDGRLYVSHADKNGRCAWKVVN